MRMSIPSKVSKAVAWAALACSFQGSLLLAQADGTPPAVGLITDVSLVDIANGQDIVISASLAPADFVPQRRTECNYALSVPNLLPDQSIASQFFSSELVQNLTLSVARTTEVATEVCISVSEPVRSQVALRPNGLTIRLVRKEREEAEATEDFRPVDATQQRSQTTAGATPSDRSSGTSAHERELELALREARVAEREAQLALAELRRQLAEQVSANARLDQELSAREGFTDLLTPRIDRLAETLDLQDSGLERPVERFDASLAMLEARLAEASTSGTDLRQLHAAVDSLLVETDRAGSELVMTNDDVNVRLEPSTSSLRVAFLPRGVLLMVLEESAGWSRVSAGDFEGWIFSDLLTAMELNGSEPDSGASSDAAATGSRADQLKSAGQRVAALVREKAALSRELANQSARSDQLAADNARLANDLARAQSASDGLGERLQQETELRAEVDRLQTELDQARLDAEQTRTVLEAERGQASRAAADSAESQQTVDQELQAVRSRILGLATLAETDRGTLNREVVRIQQQTNLRRGPSVDDERLALLPIGFELAVLRSENGWHEVVYGSLHGWVSADFATPITGAPLTGSPESESLESLLSRLERSVAAAKIAAPEFASGAAVVELGEDTQPSEGRLLQAAANAIYSRAAAWRRGDADSYIASHSPAFEPEGGTREQWQAQVRSRLNDSPLPNARVKDLRLRLIAEDLVAATFSEVGSSGSVARKVDLGFDGGSWLVLLDTEQAPASSIE